MIGIVGKNGLKNPKEDVAAAILPNGRVLASPTFIMKGATEPNPEQHRAKFTDLIKRYKEMKEKATGESVNMSWIPDVIATRLDNGYNDSYRRMLYTGDAEEQRASFGETTDKYPISDAREIIKKAGLR